jgi:hypothetical protein
MSLRLGSFRSGILEEAGYIEVKAQRSTVDVQLDVLSVVGWLG